MAGAHRAATAIDIDLGAVQILAQDLRLIRSRLKPAMRQATSASAKRIKEQAKSNIRGQTTGRTSKWYPASITFEITVSNASMVSADIGPEKHAKQGFLATILEYGTSKQGPKPHLNPAFNAEIPTFETNLGIAAADAVLP